jgi:hypothetical protein
MVVATLLFDTKNGMYDGASLMRQSSGLVVAVVLGTTIEERGRIVDE